MASLSNCAVGIGPFSYLNGKLRVLVLDDTPYVLELHTNALKHLPVFTVYSASTFEQTDKIIASNGRIHCLITDLGLEDAPVCHPVEKYANKIATVVVSGRSSMEIGGNCTALGARKTLDKPIESGKLIEVAFSAAMKGIANPQRTRVDQKLRDALDGYAGAHGVTRWALNNFLSDRYFRQKCKTILGIKAKLLHFAFEVFLAAYEYHTCGRATPPREYRRMRDYYCENREEIERLLA